MHGLLDDLSRREFPSNEGARVAPTILLLVEADAASPEQVRELVARLPAELAFVVRKEPADAHKPVVASLIAAGAVFGGAPIDGDPIRPGHIYLLDQDIAIGRLGGRFIVSQRYERPRAADFDGRPCFDRLTNRQREILGMVVAGDASKRIAASLRISQRTVENHRAAIMRRLGARTLADLVRITVIG